MVRWSIDAFAACEAVSSIIVAVPPGDEKKLGGVEALGGDAGEPPITVIAGGTARAESVANALAAVDTELVAIHDAARPLLTPELIEALVADLSDVPEAAGIIAATPVTDTIKRAASETRPALTTQGSAKAGLVVQATEDRSRLWAAQTPQVFRLTELRRALAASADPDTATDEAMLVEAAGGTVLIHPCGPENLKVTTPLDLQVAESLLSP
jgi:2-C-methyl-D-erythritol 4-phosphate cytidylyltransferase